jgi:hypothetical protein
VIGPVLHFHRSFTQRERTLYGLLIFIAAGVAFVLYRTFVPTVALVSNQERMPVVSITGTAGSRAIVYRLDYCKQIKAQSTAYRFLRQVDAPVVVSLYASGFVLPAGCHVVDIVEPMPAYVPPGRYVLDVSFVYRTNAVTHPPTFETEVFELK